MPNNHSLKSAEDFNKKEQILYHKLKLFFSGAQRIVILAVGNEMRRDDRIGIEILNELRNISILKDSQIKMINAGTTPENLTRTIENWNPSHLLIIDAVDMGEDPSEIELIQMDDISNVSVSTHKMSLTLLSKYLMNKLDLEIKLLGIQIKDVSFGDELSSELTYIPLRIAKLLNSVLKEISQQSN
ncbi:MAG: hydrogenase maturation peptidase HycI [Candidatus Sifarchaeia archaeon]|jgi:hydrogenase 3 maturation protease